MATDNAGELERKVPAIVEDLLTAGAVIPEQHPRSLPWTPEKELAAAVLTDALVEIRDHCGNPSHKNQVAEDLQWVYSNDGDWAFSFVELCLMLDLDPAYVRGTVWHWLQDALGVADPNPKSGSFPVLPQ
jgi:hypothetical protein